MKQKKYKSKNKQCDQKNFGIYSDIVNLDASSLIPSEKLLLNVLKNLESGQEINKEDVMLLIKDSRKVLSNHMELTSKFQERLTHALKEKNDLEETILNLKNWQIDQMKSDGKKNNNCCTCQKEKLMQDDQEKNPKEKSTQTEKNFSSENLVTLEENQENFSPRPKQDAQGVKLDKFQVCLQPEANSAIIIKGLYNHPNSLAEYRREYDWELTQILQGLHDSLGLDFNFMAHKWFRYKGKEGNPFPSAVYLQFKNSYQKERFKHRLSLIPSSPYGMMNLRIFNFFPLQNVRAEFRECQRISFHLRRVEGIRKVDIRMEGEHLKVFYEKEGQWLAYIQNT